MNCYRYNNCGTPVWYEEKDNLFSPLQRLCLLEKQVTENIIITVKVIVNFNLDLLASFLILVFMFLSSSSLTFLKDSFSSDEREMPFSLSCFFSDFLDFNKALFCSKLCFIA